MQRIGAVGDMDIHIPSLIDLEDIDLGRVGEVALDFSAEISMDIKHRFNSIASLRSYDNTITGAALQPVSTSDFFNSILGFLHTEGSVAAIMGLNPCDKLIGLASSINARMAFNLVQAFRTPRSR